MQKGEKELEIGDNLSVILDSLQPQKRLTTPAHNKLASKMNNQSVESSPSPTGKKIESLASRLASLPTTTKFI